MEQYKPNAALRFLYNTKAGRIILKQMVSPSFSKCIGAILDSKVSKILIPSFIKNNNIDINEYEQREYKSYNDFFKRKLAKGVRTLDTNPDSFISPCDSALTVYRIDNNAEYVIKHSRYKVKDLLRNEELANEYEGGCLMVFRLQVHNYHRYCYIDNCIPRDKTYINGILHTVQPIAFNSCNVFAENCREYTILESENFGDVIQCEVGALIVGKISNHASYTKKRRGQEKGYFEFGGSTIIMLVKKDVIKIRKDIADNSMRGIETPVKIGEKIAQKL